eukprot:gene26273-27473_t
MLGARGAAGARGGVDRLTAIGWDLGHRVAAECFWDLICGDMMTRAAGGDAVLAAIRCHVDGAALAHVAGVGGAPHPSLAAALRRVSSLSLDLVLRGLDRDDESVDVPLGALLHRLPRLEEVSVEVRSDDAGGFLSGCLRTVRFHTNKLFPATADALCRLLSRVATLQSASLSFYDDELDVAEAEALARAAPGPALAAVDLSVHAFGSAVGFELGTLLARAPGLTDVALNGVDADALHGVRAGLDFGAARGERCPVATPTDVTGE